VLKKCGGGGGGGGGCKFDEAGDHEHLPAVT